MVLIGTLGTLGTLGDAADGDKTRCTRMEWAGALHSNWAMSPWNGEFCRCHGGLDMFGHGLLWKEHERTFLYPFFIEPLCDMLMYQKCIMRVVLHGWYRPSILQAPLDCDTCMVCHLKMHPRAVFQSKFTTDETCTSWCGRLIYRTCYKAAFLHVSNTAAQTAPCALFNTWKTWITWKLHRTPKASQKEPGQILKLHRELSHAESMSIQSISIQSAGWAMAKFRNASAPPRTRKSWTSLRPTMADHGWPWLQKMLTPLGWAYDRGWRYWRYWFILLRNM